MCKWNAIQHTYTCFVQIAGKSDLSFKILFTSDQIRFVCPDISNVSAWVAVVTRYAGDEAFQNGSLSNGDLSSSPNCQKTIYFSVCLLFSVLSVVTLC